MESHGSVAVVPVAAEPTAALLSRVPVQNIRVGHDIMRYGGNFVAVDWKRSPGKDCRRPGRAESLQNDDSIILSQPL